MPLLPNLRSCVWTGLALALLGVALAPQAVQASCGDYVVTGKYAAQSDHKTPLPHVPMPCHGPGCSSRPEVPLMPAAPVVTNVDDQHYAIPILTAVAGESSTRLHREPRGLVPEPTGADIFHPPRHLCITPLA